MTSIRQPLVALLGGLGLLAAPLAGVHAATFDLTAPGTTAEINGARFATFGGETSGTGLIDSFVRIQRTGSEAGINTDVAKQADFMYDEKFGTFTHSLQLSDLQANIITVSGVDYFEFVLDINESLPGAIIDLTTVELYVTPNANGGTTTDVEDLRNPVNPADATLVYDMDGNEDNTARLDYSNFSGSGKLDMAMLVAVSAFGTDLSQYVYLYSEFGGAPPSDSDAGFEEWARKLSGTFTTPPLFAPAPPTMILLGAGLLGVAFSRRKARRG